MQLKKYSRIFLIFFIIGGIVTCCTIHAMNEKDEEGSRQTVHSELNQVDENDEYDLEGYDELETDGNDNPQLEAEKTRQNVIKSALAAGRYRTVQECVRLELEQEKTIWFGSWLRKHAFIKGEVVLLYEAARYFFTHEQANAIACEAGLKAVLLLLIRMRQDATVMNSLFDSRTEYDIVHEIRQKAKEWWRHGDIRGLPKSCNFPTILASVAEWFTDRVFDKYASCACVAHWDFTNTRYAAEGLKRLTGRTVAIPVSQTGIVFKDVPANVFRACSAVQKREGVSNIRQTVAHDMLEEFALNRTWDGFFAAL